MYCPLGLWDCLLGNGSEKLESFAVGYLVVLVCYWLAVRADLAALIPHFFWFSLLDAVVPLLVGTSFVLSNRNAVISSHGC